MLQFISGRLYGSQGLAIEGQLLLDGVPIIPSSIRQSTAYVSQENRLHSALTPRLNIFYSAMLRLPDELTNDVNSINNLVDTTLHDFNLMECADTIVGGEVVKGLSGGQKKRTSIAMEIITKPRILLLDEPTSGLDLYSACMVVELLDAISQIGTLVVASIHQPSSQVSIFKSYYFYH